MEVKRGVEGDPVGPPIDQGRDCERYVLGGGPGAEEAYLSDRVTAAGDLVDQSRTAPACEQVGSCGGGDPQLFPEFSARQRGFADCKTLVKRFQRDTSHCFAAIILHV
jgi:hypothetical protein